MVSKEGMRALPLPDHRCGWSLIVGEGAGRRVVVWSIPDTQAWPHILALNYDREASGSLISINGLDPRQAWGFEAGAK